MATLKARNLSMTRSIQNISARTTLLLGGLLIAPIAFGSGENSRNKPGALEQGLQGVADSAASTTKAEAIKRGMALVVRLGEATDPQTAAEAAKKVSETLNSLDLDARAIDAFFERVSKLDDEEMIGLVKQRGNGVLAWGKAMLKGEGRDVAGLKAILARGGDEAGLDAVKLLRRLENGLPVNEDELVKVLGKLPPEKSSTLLDAFRNEFKRGGPVKQQLMDSIGGFVDGVFVFNDAIGIYESESPAEEKAAAATGKAVEYGLGAVGNVAVAAVGGGFGAGLVLGWSAGQVGELTKEMIGLYYDRQNAALKEQWAKLELREMTLRKMLEVDRLIKAGKLDQAQQQSKKLRQFYADHQDEIGDVEVGGHLNTLDKHLDQASHKQSAILYLNEARRPYERALAKYQKRQSLSLAKEEAAEARLILERWIKNYPDLTEGLGQVRNLEAAIAQAVANATPVQLVRVQGPTSVAAGDSATFHLDVSGGIAPYCSTGNGVCGYTFAIAYVQAPAELGERTVTFQVKDDLGRTATRDMKLTVRAATEAPVAERSGTATSDTTNPSSAKRKSGVNALSEEVPASELDPACQRAWQCCVNAGKKGGPNSDTRSCVVFKLRFAGRAYCERWLMHAECD